MKSREHTCILIAHRLTTVRMADRIAFIKDGCVKELGSHEELMGKTNGRYRRLVEAQNREAKLTHTKVQEVDFVASCDADEAATSEIEVEGKSREGGKQSRKRSRQLVSQDLRYIALGCIGALLAGSTFPMLGLLYGELVRLLLRPIQECSEDSVPMGFDTCEDYWNDNTAEMKRRSFQVAGYLAMNAVLSITGSMLTSWGFGMAGQRLSKRLRDSVFTNLVRQEVAFFDQRSIGSITSQLQQDATEVHNLIGEPLRSLVIALASVLIGVGLSFYVSAELEICSDSSLFNDI